MPRRTSPDRQGKPAQSTTPNRVVLGARLIKFGKCTDQLLQCLPLQATTVSQQAFIFVNPYDIVPKFLNTERFQKQHKQKEWRK